ncbi:MAG: hypothetical protein VZS44_10310 [Bacilli bacterium]|nr:hypothetical protein [Bacilli bacterium]
MVTTIFYFICILAIAFLLLAGLLSCTDSSNDNEYDSYKSGLLLMFVSFTTIILVCYFGQNSIDYSFLDFLADDGQYRVPIESTLLYQTIDSLINHKDLSSLKEVFNIGMNPIADTSTILIAIFTIFNILCIKKRKNLEKTSSYIFEKEETSKEDDIYDAICLYVETTNFDKEKSLVFFIEDTLSEVRYKYKDLSQFEDKNTIKLIMNILDKRINPILIDIYKMTSFHKNIFKKVYVNYIDQLKILYESFNKSLDAIYFDIDVESPKHKAIILEEFLDSMDDVEIFLNTIKEDIKEVYLEEKDIANAYLELEETEKKERERKKVYTSDNFLEIKMLNRINGKDNSTLLDDIKDMEDNKLKRTT